MSFDNLPASQERSVTDFLGGLVSLKFIRAALRRNAWVWCATAILGLIIGCGLYVNLPPSYQATTSVLITNNPDQDPASAVATDIILAQSNAVAEAVVHDLGLRQSVSSFQAAYTVIALTNNVLRMTVSAPSSSSAVSRANALVAEFLHYRATVLQTQQQLLNATLDQELDQAQQQFSALEAQISSVSTQPASSVQQTELTKLHRERTNETNNLDTLEQGVAGQRANGQIITSSMVNGSQVLDSATPTKHSRLKIAVEYVGTALVAGLALGLGIVIIQAVVSDRLRRRDDVADAIGAPVRLSIGAAHAVNWRPRRAGRQVLSDRDLSRMVAHLRDAVPGSSRGAAPLAVVAIDNAPVVASAVVALAVSYTQEGRRVVVADLSGGALADVLGVRTPGISTANVGGTSLTAVVPDRGDVAPVGPVRRTSVLGQAVAANAELLAACAAADVVLTLANIEPAVGAEHLATWAADVVAVVTAGRSSIARVGAVGEMLRTADLTLASVVLLEADQADESLGTGSLRDDVPTAVDLGISSL
jgi:capsular polysaccharide biosynthesis protein